MVGSSPAQQNVKTKKIACTQQILKQNFKTKKLHARVNQKF